MVDCAVARRFFHGMRSYIDKFCLMILPACFAPGGFASPQRPWELFEECTESMVRTEGIECGSSYSYSFLASRMLAKQARKVQKIRPLLACSPGVCASYPSPGKVCPKARKTPDGALPSHGPELHAP